MPTASKRRIPDELRRRAQVSCDRCKLRRIRCIRANQDESCRTCLDNGVACESTLPRKHRIYGSIETLGARYQALDALVRGIFQGEEIGDTDQLYRLAQERNIPMPPRSEGDGSTTAPLPHSPRPPAQVRQEQQRQYQVVQVQNPQQPTLYPSPDQSTHDRSQRGPPSINTPSESQSTHFPNSTDDNPFAQQPRSNLEEDLVPTPYGVWHYVGPSSSFKFATTVRSMVSRAGATSPDGTTTSATGSSGMRIPPRRPQTAVWSDFTGPLTSKALEPRTPDAMAEDEHVDSERSSTRRSAPATRSTPTMQPPSSRDPKHGALLRLIDILPRREVADALIRTFFERIHTNYPMFHRGIFQLRYETVWDRDKHKGKESLEIGWTCCLLLAFAFGAQAHEHHDERAAAQAKQIQRRSLSFVRARLHQLIGTTSLANVQALLLLQLYEHNSGERNRAWMLLGAASRMAIALGMHREGPTASFDAIERNVRRRTWWTLYLFEQNLCLVLGRPSAIDDLEVSVGLPDENILDGSSDPPRHLEYSLSLTRICVRIKHNIYPAGVNDDSSLPHPNVAHEMLQEIDNWYQSLPSHLTLHNQTSGLLPRQRRAVILLHIAYHHAKSLVTRPYLLQKIESEITRTPLTNDFDSQVLELAYACQGSARDAMALLQDLATANLVDGVGWYDVYYAYHGVLVLCLEFLMRPISSNPSPSSSPNRGVLTLAESENLRYNKQAVGSVLDVLRHVRLSPTYHILLQVAIQFARIVSVVADQAWPPLNTTNGDQPLTNSQSHQQRQQFDNQSNEAHSTPYRSDHSTRQQGSTQTLSTPTSVQIGSNDSRGSNLVPIHNNNANANNLVDGWFQGHFSDPPWDFFNAGNYSYNTDDVTGNLMQLFNPGGIACTATFGNEAFDAFMDDDDADYLSMRGLEAPNPM